MGMGSVVLGSPIALMAALSCGVMPGCARRLLSIYLTVTWLDVAVGALETPTTSCGRLNDEVSEPDEGCCMLPKISPTAGPTVTVSCAPSMPFGSGGSVLPCLTAEAEAVSALKVNTAVA